jgi:hypothetical protein
VVNIHCPIVAATAPIAAYVHGARRPSSTSLQFAFASVNSAPERDVTFTSSSGPDITEVSIDALGRTETERSERFRRAVSTRPTTTTDDDDE